MNVLKKVLSLLLVGVMIFSFSACHPKDEIALTIGDVKFTSALYMYALITADGEARTKVDEDLAAKNTSSSNTSSTASEVNYNKQSIDGKNYSDWVKSRAIEICSEFAAFETLCKENNLILSSKKVEEINSYANYYWTYYGYSTLYGSNGVGFETFKKGFSYSYLSTLYFEHLYGEGGKKAVSKDEVTKTMSENFVIANLLEASTGDNLKADEVTALKDKFNGYVDRLKKGASFEEIYNEYYEVKDDDKTSSDKEEEEPKPKDSFATLIGSSKTDYANDVFDTVKEMAVGEIKLIDDDKTKTIKIVIKGDVMADEYWINNLNTPTLSILKMEEYQADIAKYAKTLKVDINSYAVNRFKVKKINYDVAN